MACGVFAYLRGSGPCVDGTRPSVGRRAGPSCRGARMPESLRGTRPEPRTQSIRQGSVEHMRRCAYTRCHNWSHHEHQPPIPQRLAQGTTTQTGARRLRRVRDLRTTSRQITAHTTPVERRGRRDHPGVTRRRPIGMGQRATDTPPLQPAQKQPQRRVRASAAHTNTTTESDQFAAEHEHMVNTNNPTATTPSRTHPREGTRPAPSRGPRAKRRYLPDMFPNSQE